MPRAIASPRPPRYDSAAALKHLAAADPKLARLIQRAGPFTLRTAGGQSPFEALVESIVYQQLHGKAAATIHRRLLESFAPVPVLAASGTGTHPTPQQILDCPNAQLRAAGLSQNNGSSPCATSPPKPSTALRPYPRPASAACPTRPS